VFPGTTTDIAWSIPLAATAFAAVANARPVRTTVSPATATTTSVAVTSAGPPTIAAPTQAPSAILAQTAAAMKVPPVRRTSGSAAVASSSAMSRELPGGHARSRFSPVSNSATVWTTTAMASSTTVRAVLEKCAAVVDPPSRAVPRRNASATAVFQGSRAPRQNSWGLVSLATSASPASVGS